MKALVVVRPGSDRETFLADMANMGLAAKPIDGLARHFLVEGQIDLDVLATYAMVESAEEADKPIFPCDQSISIDVTLANGSWALPRIIRRRAPWNVDQLRHPISTFFRAGRDGTGVDIYIVDTGIDIAHAVFGGRASIVYEYYSSGGLNDDVGHGTGVSSCAAGDIVGIARGASLFGFKIGQAPSGASTNTALTTAIGQLLTHYAGRTNPAVCNISYLFSSTAVLSAIASLIDAGIVVCGPAGNAVTDLSTIDVFPAEAPDAICVAGLGMADLPYYGFGVDKPTSALTFGTNYGSSVSIMAPAQGVKVAAASVLSVGSYFVAAGTSYASPMAAGVVACMLQDYQKPTTRTQVQAIKAKLLANATTGKLRTAYGLTPLPDKILYLDPNQIGPEPIDGLTVSVYRMVAGSGSFALTGINATLITNLIMAADMGAFALTGIDATLGQNPSMTADYGSFTLTGIDAILGQNPSMTADYGSFALTGNDATLVADLTMTAAQGSFTLTGNNAGFSIGDAYFSSVVFLSGFEGADASTSFTDESNSAHALTAVGDAQVDTAQFKFGSSSVLFDGTGDMVTAPDSADFTFGSGQFTVELFIRFSSGFGTTEAFCGQWGATTAETSWFFFLLSGSLMFRMMDSGSVTRDTSVAWTPTVNTWYHLAVDRDASNKFRVYRDGAMVASATYSQTMKDGTGLFGIGSIPGQTTTAPLNGWIDELRITKGVARYASDSGFTVPSAAYPRS